jgi:PIN domain nuclease of toxin-antitoxin system
VGSAPVDRFLLDTHVWIWLANGADGLRPSTLEAIRQAAQESRLAISAISLWEVAMLAAKGRLHFHVDVQDWIDASLSQIGLQIVPISPQIACSHGLRTMAKAPAVDIGHILSRPGDILEESVPVELAPEA